MPARAINELLDTAIGYPDVAILVPQERMRIRADSDRNLSVDRTSVTYAGLFVSCPQYEADKAPPARSQEVHLHR